MGCRSAAPHAGLAAHRTCSSNGVPCTSGGGGGSGARAAGAAAVIPRRPDRGAGHAPGGVPELEHVHGVPCWRRSALLLSVGVTCRCWQGPPGRRPKPQPVHLSKSGAEHTPLPRPQRSRIELPAKANAPITPEHTQKARLQASEGCLVLIWHPRLCSGTCLRGREEPPLPAGRQARPLSLRTLHSTRNTARRTEQDGVSSALRQACAWTWGNNMWQSGAPPPLLLRLGSPGSALCEVPANQQRC